MKYLDLYHRLKQSIHDGQYPPNTHIPHTQQLIEQNKVSLSTINKAVKLLESDGLIKRIKGKGTFVLEQNVQSALAYKKSNRIGLAFNGFLTEMLNLRSFANALRGIEGLCRKNNKSLVMLGTENRKVADFLNEIKWSGVSGVIVFGANDNALYSELKRMGLPIVCCDYIDFNIPADQVTGDFIKAGAIALKKLFELNHQKILFFGTHKKRSFLNDRDHEYWSASIGIEAKFLRVKNYEPHFISFEGGIQKMRSEMLKILDARLDYTGYICASTSYYELLKSILENEAGFDKLPRDVVLFSNWDEKN